MNTLLTALTTDEIVVHDGPGWWPIFPILWFLFVLTAIVVATRLGRRRWRHCAPSTGHARLAERFASGDIEENEYRARLAVLDEHRGRR